MTRIRYVTLSLAPAILALLACSSADDDKAGAGGASGTSGAGGSTAASAGTSAAGSAGSAKAGAAGASSPGAACEAECGSYCADPERDPYADNECLGCFGPKAGTTCAVVRCASEPTCININDMADPNSYVGCVRACPTENREACIEACATKTPAGVKAFEGDFADCAGCPLLARTAPVASALRASVVR
jgi:hypothetical protein